MAKGIKAGTAFVELGLGDRLNAGLMRAGQRLKMFGAQVANVGAKLAMMSVAILAPLVLAAKAFASMGDTVGKMARRTGLSTEALSELSFAAERSGTDLASFEKGVRRMQQTIFDAERELSTALDAFEALGLTLRDLQGLKPEDQFLLIADTISKIEDPTRKAAVSIMVFGRAGTAMIPMLENGAKGIDDLRQKAHRLGLTISTEDALAAEEFTDVLGDMWTVMKHMVFLVGASLTPIFQDLAKWITETAGHIRKWIDENRELIRQYATMAVKTALWVGGIGLALIVMGKIIAVIGTAAIAIKGMISAVKGLNVALAFLSANPIVLAALAAAAVIGGVALVVRHLTRDIEKLDDAMAKPNFSIMQRYYSGKGRTGKPDAASPGIELELSKEAIEKLAREKEKAAQEAARKEEEAARQAAQIAEANADREYTNREQMLRLVLKGGELETALSEMRFRRAMKEAAARKENLDLVRQEFDLEQMLTEQKRIQDELRERAADAADRISAAVRGTFSAAAAGMMGYGPRTALGRIVAATEATAQSNQEILEGDLPG